MRIDLNADVGEGLAASGPVDAGLMRSITSANVAAGFHGGDPSILRDTIRLARVHGVGVGAHPSFADRLGFGRREMALSPAEVENLVLYQVAAVAGVAAVEGVRLQHVKPHGALYNMAARDPELAQAIARAVVAIDPRLILVGPPGSCLVTAGRDAGLRVAAEVFADRAYEPDGTLVSRGKPGAVLHDPPEVVSRAIRMITEHEVMAVDGSVLGLGADTLGIHSDTAAAGHLAAVVRAGLEAAGISVRPLGAP